MADNTDTNEILVHVSHENVQQVAKIAHMAGLEYMGVMPRSLNELCFLGLALGAEAGKMQSLIEEVMREKQLTPEQRTAIAEGVAEVFSNVFLLGNALGMDIGLAFRQKISKLVNEEQPVWVRKALPRLIELYGTKEDGDATTH